MEEFITLKTYVFQQEMLVDRSKLDAFGIPCFVKDEHIVLLHNFYSQAVGGVKLQVRESFYRQALEVLSQKNDLQIDYSDSKLRCCKCASGNVRREKVNRPLSFVIAWLISIPLPLPSRKYFCFECHEITQL